MWRSWRHIWMAWSKGRGKAWCLQDQDPEYSSYSISFSSHELYEAGITGIHFTDRKPEACGKSPYLKRHIWWVSSHLMELSWKVSTAGLRRQLRRTFTSVSLGPCATLHFGRASTLLSWERLACLKTPWFSLHPPFSWESGIWVLGRVYLHHK